MPKKKHFIIFILILIVPVVAGDLTGFPIIPRSHRFAELDTAGGRYFIEGEAVPLAGWYQSLFWKRPHEPWVAYNLEHDEPYWFNVRLVEVGDRIRIMRGEVLFGEFVPSLHTFQKHTIQGTVLPFSEPGLVILGDDPLNLSNAVVQGSKEWPSVWPHYLKQEAIVPSNSSGEHIK